MKPKQNLHIDVWVKDSVVVLPEDAEVDITNVRITSKVPFVLSGGKNKLLGRKDNISPKGDNDLWFKFTENGWEMESGP